MSVLACAMLLADIAHAETVIARRRLGNNAEAMTYDPFNDRAVVMDGNDVIGVALNPLDAIVLATMRNETGGEKGIGFRKLFDVLALPLEARIPRGIVYIPTQHRYIFTSIQPGGTDAFYSTNESGHPLPPIVLKGLVQPVDYWEGLAWIPPGRRRTVEPRRPRLQDLREPHLPSLLRPPRRNRRAGDRAATWNRPGGVPLRSGVLARPSFAPTGQQLLLGVFGMDARTGAAVGDQPLFLTPPGVAGAEGLIVRRDGSLALSGYSEGRLYAYDRALHRKPADDRLFVLGLGATVFWLAWNYDTNEFLGLAPANGHLYAISPDLESARVVFDVPVTNETPNAGSIGYLGENLVGLGNRGAPRGIEIAQLFSDRPEFPNGTSVSRLLFQGSPAFPSGQAFNPRGFSLLEPSTFVVRVVGDPSALKVVTRGGTPDSSLYRDGVVPERLPDIVLSSPTAGFAAQVFDVPGGRRIFTGAEIYGLDGTLIHRIDWQQLGLAHPAEDGVWIGGNTFATVDTQTSTIVVYSVP
jgi:hypothetical protein